MIGKCNCKHKTFDRLSTAFCPTAAEACNSMVQRPSHYVLIKFDEKIASTFYDLVQSKVMLDDERHGNMWNIPQGTRVQFSVMR